MWNLRSATSRAARGTNPTARVLAATFCLLCVHDRAAAEQEFPNPWPQWRGPQGLGVSSAPNLPVTWSADSPNIKWKTFIPGRGNSSPIVSNGRVILTTAYESPLTATLQKAVIISAISLTIIFLTASFIVHRRSWLGRHRSSCAAADMAPTNPTVSTRVPKKVIILSSALFLFFALLITVAGERSNWVFGRIGRLLAIIGLEDAEHLCSMSVGVPAAIWLTSGAVALFGLVVALAYMKARLFWRLSGAFIVLVCAIGLVLFTPLDQWKEKARIWERLLFIAPALVLLLWSVFSRPGWLQIKASRLAVRLGMPYGNGSPPANLFARITNAIRALNYVEIRCNNPIVPSLSAWGCLTAETARSLSLVLPLTLFSLLVFVPPNFIQPRLGLERVVVCMDAGTGKILWQRTIFVGPAERIHSDNSYATPTPAADGQHIVVDLGLGAAALDFNGNVLWKKSAWGCLTAEDPAYLRNSRYGAAGSPLLIDSQAVVMHQREGFSNIPTSLAAYDVRSGDCIWQVNPDNIRNSYSTPLVCREPNGPTQLLVPSWAILASFDLQTGQQLWSIELPSDQLVASPARSGDLLCIAGSTWGRNAITVLRLKPSGAKPAAQIIWQTDRDTPGNCSPVIYKDRLFVLTDSGKLTCYNAQTGQIIQSKRLKGGRYLASLVVADGKLYACNTKGLTTVIAVEPPVASPAEGRIELPVASPAEGRIEPELKVLAENQLDGRCYASPAIADGCILLRIGSYLYCIANRSP